MTPVSAATVFIVIWWMVFLMVLPFRSTPPEQVGEGHAGSAPEKPMMKKKLGITTLISIVLFIIIVLVIQNTSFSFRDL